MPGREHHVLLDRALRANLERTTRGRFQPAAVAQVFCGAALALVAAGILYALGVSLAAADVSLVVVVAAASLLGAVAGISAAVTAFLVFLYAFEPPVGTISFNSVDDFLLLVATVSVAGVVGLLVARLNHLRARALESVRDTHLRLTVTQRLLAHDATPNLLRDIADELTVIYDFDECQLGNGGELPGPLASATPGPRPDSDGDTVHIAVGSLILDATRREPLENDERTSLEALVSALALAFDHLRLEQEANARAVEIDLARTRAGFLTAVTHDVRTPLATIKAASAALLVSDSPLDEPERRDLARTIHDEATDLQRLVNNVLELTRVRAGTIRALQCTLEADEFLADLVRQARVEYPDRTLDLHLDDTVHTRLIDPVVLQPAVTNLVRNALDHTPITTGAEIAATAVGARGLRITVVDHGAGIPPGDRERIFDEFVRLHDDRRGMGLGLAIARACVEAHGGSLALGDTPGGGATFVVEIDAEPPRSGPGPGIR